jgi:hypothetical protein
LEKAKALGNELVGNHGMMRFYQGEAAATGKVLSRNDDRNDSETLINLLTVAARSCVLVIQSPVAMGVMTYVTPRAIDINLRLNS